MKQMLELPAGIYVIKRHIPTYQQSWRDTPKGVQRPRTVHAHWIEVTIKSDLPIKIYPKEIHLP